MGQRRSFSREPCDVRGNIRETLKRFRIGFGYQVTKGELEKWEDKDNSWFAAVFFWVVACWNRMWDRNNKIERKKSYLLIWSIFWLMQKEKMCSHSHGCAGVIGWKPSQPRSRHYQDQRLGRQRLDEFKTKTKIKTRLKPRSRLDWV